MTWISWPLRAARFWAWFAWEILTASTAVLRDNLTPGQDSTPGIAEFTTRCVNDHELTLLAALITLTPGTLTLGTSRPPGRSERVLLVHALYHDSAGALRDDLADMEHRMLTALRWKGTAS